jgi:DNA-binding PadR family transcriptional regulator
MLIIKPMRRRPGALLPIEEGILVVVARLRRRGIAETHGYEIAKQIRDVADAKRLTAYGTLYRALARLEQMGLLASRWEDGQQAAREGRPGRRLYTLTSAGATAVPATRAARHRGAVRHRRPVRV